MPERKTKNKIGPNFRVNVGPDHSVQFDAGHPIRFSSQDRAVAFGLLAMHDVAAAKELRHVALLCQVSTDNLWDAWSSGGWESVEKFLRNVAANCSRQAETAARKRKG